MKKALNKMGMASSVPGTCHPKFEEPFNTSDGPAVESGSGLDTLIF